MLVDERARRTLFDALEQALGREAADTMMAHLPPVGWADVATKQDLLVLRADLTEAIATSQARQTRLFIGWNGAMLLAWAGTLIGILQYMG